MWQRRQFLLSVPALALAGCASRFRGYDGPEVTRLLIRKRARGLYLLHGARVLESYRIDLGSAPSGPKRFSGDGRTPEGRYVIDRRNPESRYHLSIGISYPNAEDVRRARLSGRDPGGDIFIHGASNTLFGAGKDWTAGCISVGNGEIEEIYAMVRNGTPIDILP